MGIIAASGTEYIDFSQIDFFDSRDIIARIEELQGNEDIGLPLDSDEEEELSKLKEFVEENAHYFPDWEDGETFIADDYFIQYAQELADDSGAINTDASWPLMHIDWEAAADSLKMDYISVVIDGRTFWGRA